MSLRDLCSCQNIHTGTSQQEVKCAMSSVSLSSLYVQGLVRRHLNTAFLLSYLLCNEILYLKPKNELNKNC